MTPVVPVVLLTGFLGSGKTTLLNRLLERRPAGRGRYAIIVNELGSVGIDADLLPAGMARQVELPGGCICCVLSEDLHKTIVELLASAPDVELIVIETTGIAEPLPISWTLEAESLSDHVRLAAIITVIDALEHERHRGLAPSVDTQVEYADLLVISKVDLLPHAKPSETLERSVRDLNPNAPIFYGDGCDVADALWKLLDDPSMETVARPARASHSHESGHGFEALTMPIEDLLDFEELSEALAELPGNYIRIKGIAQVIDGSTGSDQPHYVAFHRVGTRVSRERLATPAATRMVALGTNLEAAPLAACIEAAVVRCGSKGN